MQKSTKIDVCIVTYKRPLMLAALFSSLARQDLDRIAMRIVVIDNDREQTAYAAVESFRENHLREVIYDVEPQQNIALARNRALRHVTAEYFAFVDDDESVSQYWLQELLRCMVQHRADIVFGPVHSTLPVDAPKWAMALFSKPRRQSGIAVQYGGAGNALIKRDIMADPAARFDPSFGLTGGEDTDLFYRLFLSGRRLVWCEEAWAAEPVPSARLTLQWVRRRGFRSGQTYNRVFVARYSHFRKAIWMMKKTGQLVSGIVAAPVIRCISYPRYVALTVKLASASGQLSSCFSRENFEEYSTRHYQ